MYAFPYVPKEEEGKLSTSCQAFNHKAKMYAWNNEICLKKKKNQQTPKKPNNKKNHPKT